MNGLENKWQFNNTAVIDIGNKEEQNRFTYNIVFTLNFDFSL